MSGQESQDHGGRGQAVGHPAPLVPVGGDGATDQGTHDRHLDSHRRIFEGPAVDDETGNQGEPAGGGGIVDLPLGVTIADHRQRQRGGGGIQKDTDRSLAAVHDIAHRRHQCCCADSAQQPGHRLRAGGPDDAEESGRREQDERRPRVDPDVGEFLGIDGNEEGCGDRRSGTEAVLRDVTDQQVGTGHEPDESRERGQAVEVPLGEPGV